MTQVAMAVLLVVAGLAGSVGNLQAEHKNRHPQELLARIAVVPELRVSEECPEYNRGEYKYNSRSLREQLLRVQGRVTAYVRRQLPSDDVTGKHVQVEHIVATKEAHESGACQWSPGERSTFASDVLNLALAVPSVNRAKWTHDLGDGWMPQYNRCWYVATVVRVKAHYGLTMDRREHNAARRVIEGCQAFERNTSAARGNH